jgi:hypothetical protein
MKIKHLVANEIEKDIYFCVWTFKEIQTLSDKLLKDKLSKDDYWEVKWLCLTEKSNIMCCVVTDNCPVKQYNNVLNHEIVHGVHYMLDYIWHWLDYDWWTEILAYYTSYYVKQWAEFISSLKKKWQTKNLKKTVKK